MKSITRWLFKALTALTLAAPVMGSGIYNPGTGTGGSGGSSSLEVMANGLRVSSPTATINFVNGTNVTITGVNTAGSTATITVNSTGGGIVSPGTFTWTNNYGLSLSTVSVSTATIYNLAVSSYATFVGKPFAVMGRSLIPGETDNPGNLGILGTYSTPISSNGGGYKVGATMTLSRNGGTIYLGNTNGGSAASTICIGDTACQSIASGATGNTVMGNAAAQSLSAGTDNVCVGNQSCFPMTSSQNVGLGAFALASLTSGANNVAIGWDSSHVQDTGTGNTCIGWDVCDRLTSGNSNVVMGDHSGADITTGSRNTFIGGGTNAFQPGQGILTGSSNTFVGAGSGGANYLNLNGSEAGNSWLGYQGSLGRGVNYAMGFGYQTVVTSSNTVVFGSPGFYGEELDVYTSTMTPYELTLGTSTAIRHVTVSTSGVVNIRGLSPSSNICTDSSSNLTTTGCTTGSGSGSSTLEVMANGLRVSSPTASINMVSGSGISITGALAGGSTAQLTISATGSGGGIVSPGSFTWQNTFGLALSTITVSSNTILSGATFYQDGTDVVGGMIFSKANGIGYGIAPTGTSTSLEVAGVITADTNFFSSGYYQGGYFLQNTSLKPALVMNQAGSRFGVIENSATNVWDLGHSASATSLGTPVLSWTQNNQVLGPSSSFVASTSSMTIAGAGGLGVTYGVSAGSLTVNDLTASQLVVTNSSKKLVSQSVLYSTMTLTFKCTALDKLETNFAVNTATNTATSNYLTCSFDNTTRQYVNGFFKVPDNIDTNGTITIRTMGRSSTAAASKNVGWFFEHQPLANGDANSTAYLMSSSGDLALSATQGVNDTLGWTMSVSSSTWAANDVVNFRFSRNTGATNNLASPYYTNLISIELPVTAKP